MTQAPTHWGDEDRRWMRRALRLASLSLGWTAPNPGVGCVLVSNGEVIGEGRHQRCGAAHAEVQALAAAVAAGNDPRGATAYVTLAPCTRHGRTPPCTRALIQAGVHRVVAALVDPVQDPAEVPLAAAGIAYETGCEGEIARHLHGGWLQRVSIGLPRCTGKWAMSLDGFIAGADGRPVAISGAQARARSRRRRRAVDALVVGVGTVIADDPQLLAADGPHPARVVISAQARLPLTARLLSTLDQSPLWLIYDHRASPAALKALVDRGVIAIEVNDAHRPDLVLRALGEQGCNEVLVEGGAALHAAFVAADAYDRLELDHGAVLMGHGIPVLAQGLEMAHQRWQSENEPQRRGDTLCSQWRRVAR